MQADYGKSRDFNYFEIAVLAGAPKLVRGMIVRRMGSSVPFDERAHFVPLLDGEPAWRAVAHYHKPEDAYVLLVDRKGVVLSRIEGDATNAAYADFKRQVESMLRATEVP